MKFWSYIGEVCLFRWVSGALKGNRRVRGMSDDTGCSANREVGDNVDSSVGYGRRYDSSYRYDRQEHGWSQSYDDFHDEQDDCDMMDDW